MIDNQNRSEEESNQKNDKNLKYSESDQRNDSQIRRTSEENNHININMKIPEQLENSECPICLTKIEVRAYTESCLHEFCRNCIEKWSHSHNNCPICRQIYTSIVCNIRSNTEYDCIPVSKPFSGSHTGMLLVDENIGLLFTPLDSGIYMINRRQTPHGIQQNIIFLAPNQNFILENMSSNVTFIRPQELDYVLSDFDETEAVIQNHNTRVRPVSAEDQQRENIHQNNIHNN